SVLGSRRRPRRAHLPRSRPRSKGEEPGSARRAFAGRSFGNAHTDSSGESRKLHVRRGRPRGREPGHGTRALRGAERAFVSELAPERSEIGMSVEWREKFPFTRSLARSRAAVSASTILAPYGAQARAEPAKRPCRSGKAALEIEAKRRRGGSDESRERGAELGERRPGPEGCGEPEAGRRTDDFG